MVTPRPPQPPPPHGGKRASEDRSGPAAQRRRVDPPPPPAALPDEERLYVGSIVSYDAGKGYGFIQSDLVEEGDIYFQRALLPPDGQNAPRGALNGQAVEFSLHLTPDGRPRADLIRFLGRVGSAAKGGSGSPHEPKEVLPVPPPPLDEGAVDDMTRFLEDHGGAVDFVLFARHFQGVKKGSLEEYFRLLPVEDDNSRGRTQITLPDVEPLTKAELDAQREVKQEDGKPEGSRTLGHFTGGISLYDPFKGYGFIKSDEVREGDVYFRRSELPEEVSGFPRHRLVGATVEFDCFLTPQGKARAENIQLKDDVGGPEPDAGEEDSADAKKDRAAALPPLDPDTIAEMTQFLEDQGGAMDYGKFSNAFAGVKKPQLEGHFTLVPESGNAGGRWQITLVGADPLPPREPREYNNYPPGPPADRHYSWSNVMEPSQSFWLLGCVKKWDQRKNFGFLETDGVPDVFLHRNDMPPELQAFRGNLQGMEMAFELGLNEDGKLRATSVRALLEPNGRGGWQPRFA